MSIRDDAYQLCRAVGNTSSRKRVAEIISSLDQGGDLGYYGHRQYAQILGYLAVEQKRTELMEGPFPKSIMTLQEEDRKLLEGIHNKLVSLNEQCVAPLTSAMPKCALAVNPYNHISYTPSSDVIESDLLPLEVIEAMASSFHNHPQIAKAIESSGIISEEFSPQEYAQRVIDMREEFIKAGACETPQWLTNTTLFQKEDSPQRTFIRHIAALVSVRESLGTLNQLIYQKILSDQLVELDDDHIIKMVGYGSNGGIAIIYQNAGLLVLTEVSDLIYVNFRLWESQIKELCRVDYLEDIMADFGEPQYVELRVVDENLNPYGRLLDRL